MATEEEQRKAYEEERKVAGDLFQLSCTGGRASFSKFVQEKLDNDFKLVQHYKDGNQRTPLHFASHSGRKEICEVILENNPGYIKQLEEDADGYTPIGLAIRSGHLDIAKFFLEQTDLSNEQKQKEIDPRNCYNAASSGNFELLKLLFDMGGKKYVNDILPHGSILHGAVFAAIKDRDCINCVKFVIDAGADVNITDPDGITPLMVAVTGDNAELIDILLEAGAKAETGTKKGSSIFHAMVEADNFKILKYFLDFKSEQFNGEILLRKNAEKKSPLDLSVILGASILFEEMIAFMQKQGVEKIFPVDTVTDMRTYKSFLKASDKATLDQFSEDVPHKLEMAEKLKAEGNGYFQKGNLVKSLEIYTSAATLLGDCLKSLNEALASLCFPTTVEIFESRFVVPVRLRTAVILNNRSLNCLKLEKVEDAATDGKQAKELDPDNLKGYLRYGQAKEALNDFAEAAQSYWDGFSKFQDWMKKDANKYNQEDGKMLFDLFQEAVEKGKSQERRKNKTPVTFDHVVPIEIPVDALGTQYKKVDLKFNQDDNEAKVAGEFIQRHNLHPSLAQMIVEHIIEKKRQHAQPKT